MVRGTEFSRRFHTHDSAGGIDHPLDRQRNATVSGFTYSRYKFVININHFIRRRAGAR